jgi:hypothetical protein
MRIMRLLELQPHQFKKIDTLPDVEIAPRSNTGVASGIYLSEISGGRVHSTKPSELDDSKNYLWVTVEKAQASQVIRLPLIASSFRFDERDSTASRWIAFLNKYGDVHYDGLVVLTPRAQKKYDMDDKHGLDYAVWSCLDGMKDKIVGMLEIPTSAEMGYSRYANIVLSKLTESYDGWDSQLVTMTSRMTISFPEFREATNRRARTATKIMEQYPMIFNVTERSTRQYVELMDLINAEKENSDDDSE